MDQCFQELEKMENDRTAILQMQKNARKLAENYFRKELVVQRLLSVIQPEKHPPMQGDEVYILTALKFPPHYYFASSRVRKLLD